MSAAALLGTQGRAQHSRILREHSEQLNKGKQLASDQDMHEQARTCTGVLARMCCIKVLLVHACRMRPASAGQWIYTIVAPVAMHAALTAAALLTQR